MADCELNSIIAVGKRQKGNSHTYLRDRARSIHVAFRMLTKSIMSLRCMLRPSFSRVNTYNYKLITFHLFYTSHQDLKRHFVSEPGVSATGTGKKHCRNFASSAAAGAMDLKAVVRKLEEFAPTSLAGSWDNVGLLVEPTPPHQVSTMCLTNDLTEEVLAEAVRMKTDFILSYHPPIFAPLKRLTMKSVKEKIIVGAIEKRIAVYSPHTSYDAVEGGVNDWLVEGLGETVESRPLDPCLNASTPSGDNYSITLMSSRGDVASTLQSLPAAHFVSCTAAEGGGFQISCSCRESDLGQVVSSIQDLDSVDRSSLRITQLMKAPMVNTGVGRIATLRQPAPVAAMVERIKAHLKLSHVQVALGSGKTTDTPISTVAICAGSGASVLKNVKADLFLTGEMSHHDILAAVAVGTTVVVCNHSNTERGFLHVLQTRLIGMFEGKVNVFVSDVDQDPLQVF